MKTITRRFNGRFPIGSAGFPSRVVSRLVPTIAVLTLYCGCMLLSNDAANYLTANAYAFVPDAVDTTVGSAAYGKFAGENDVAHEACDVTRVPCENNAAIDDREKTAMLVSYTSSSSTDLVDVSLDTSNRHLRLAEAFNATRAKKHDPAFQRIPVVVLK